MKIKNRLCSTILFLIMATHVSSCFSVRETEKVANEWCDCFAKNTSNNLSLNCDSIAQETIQKLIEKKWVEIKEKGLPPDTIRTFKLSLDNEFHDYVEKCRKK